MAEVASRELRNQTRAVLERVEAGEEVTITVGGRPVAVLRPVPTRPTWMSGEELFRDADRWRADPALAQELRELSPDTTDDIPFR